MAGQDIWNPTRIWADQTVFIVGGGPSLRRFDFSRLRNRHVLAVNAAGYDVPWAKVLFFRDPEWYRDNETLVLNWAGLVVSVSREAKRVNPRVLRVAVGGRLRRARTSGHMAVDLAGMMGASRIILLGFDHNRDGGNYHGRHRGPGLEYTGGLLEQWDAYKKTAKREGIVILNATRRSRITAFPFCDIDEWL